MNTVNRQTVASRLAVLRANSEDFLIKGENLEKEKPKRTPVEPWRPSRIAALIVLFTPLAAGVLAWNWRRLNKRAWFGPAMALSLIPLPVLVIMGIVILTAMDPVGSDMAIWLGLAPLMAGVGWQYGIIAAQWYLQGPAYQHYQDKPDWEGLAAYDYPLRNAAIILIAVSIAFPAFVGVLVALDV